MPVIGRVYRSQLRDGPKLSTSPTRLTAANSPGPANRAPLDKRSDGRRSEPGEAQEPAVIGCLLPPASCLLAPDPQKSPTRASETATTPGYISPSIPVVKLKTHH